MDTAVKVVGKVLGETWDLYLGVSIYLLFGLVVAGILYALFPHNFVARHLGKGSTSAVIKASIFGIPLPLCSCGVIPTALSLRKRGASRGATLSFMISTPQTGVDSILLTVGLFGWPFALLRAFFSLVTAMLTGLVANLVYKDDPPDPLPDAEDAGAQAAPASLAARTMDMIHYAFVELLGSIYKWLIVGLLLAGVIASLPLENFLQGPAGQGLTGKLVMLAIGIPMYICATASTPIAYSLVGQGMSVGGAFVFLMAGPATNAATITMVARYLGKKSVVIYLVCIAVVSVASGMLIDLLLPGYRLADFAPSHEHDHWLLTYLSAAVLTLLLLNLAVRETAARLRPRTGKPVEEEEMPDHTMTLKVEGMTCMHCKGTVERVVGALPGVGAVLVDLAAKAVQIDAAEQMPPVERIKQAIEAEGYEVVD